MQFNAVKKLITDHDVKFIDLRFTDTLSKEHHVSLPAHRFTKDLVSQGQPFDGSSIAGWKGIENSDMLLKLDLATTKLDPFYDQRTLSITWTMTNITTFNLNSR